MAPLISVEPEGTRLHDVEPFCVLLHPAGHDAHVVCFFWPWYRPTPHEAHAAAPPGPYDPAGQAIWAVDPSARSPARSFPGSMKMQLDAPSSGWNVDALHGVHSDDALEGANQPGGQGTQMTDPFWEA